jgi:hypothetical protein
MIEEAKSWFEEEWVLGWCGLAISVIGGVVVFLRSRESSRLEVQKLELEIANLRNDPSVVAERREIYDRLSAALSRITGNADADYDDISELHEVVHDASFRFPDEIVAGMKATTRSAIQLHSTNAQLNWSVAQGGAANHSELSERNDAALTQVAAYSTNLVDTFKPHVSR